MSNRLPTIPTLITHSNKLNYGLFFLVLGWACAFIDSWWIVEALFFTFALSFWILGTFFFAKSVYLAPYKKQIELLRHVLLWLPILLMFVVSLPVAMAALSFGVIFRIGLKKTITPNSVYQHNVDAKHVTSIPQQNNEATFHRQQKLSITEHAGHLAQLLSTESFEYLLELITAINELSEKLHYLENNHAYIANSVHELIQDLTQNTIIRLDNVAKKFVENDNVHPQAQALFTDKHEPNIKQLLQDHLLEIQALNQSIIEKQMAGFDAVGSDSELRFRDSVMELKILLKWLIAQTPDNTVSSHQVLLKKLEESTLKQMQTAFFDAETTAQQKQTLQSQIDELINHFKTQNSELSSSSDDIQLLTYESNTIMDKINAQSIKHQKTQQFIEFNEQYVKQLKKHWH